MEENNQKQFRKNLHLFLFTSVQTFNYMNAIIKSLKAKPTKSGIILLQQHMWNMWRWHNAACNSSIDELYMAVCRALFVSRSLQFVFTFANFIYSFTK